jgi:hypothetical protein
MRFGNKAVEGDFRSFDLSAPVDLHWAAHQLIYMFLKRAGYNQFALNMVRGLLTDRMHTIISVLNDLLEIMALTLSGNYATAEYNSLLVTLLTFYIMMLEKLESLIDNEEYALADYGDDLLLIVRDALLGAKRFAYLLREHLGMVFTNADKSETIRDFTELSEMSFLKRNFRFDSRFDRYMAPLDPNSINKMLKWTIPSNAVTPAEQAKGTFSSALWEGFLHLDESKFDRFRNVLMNWYEMNFSIPGDCLPTYELIRNTLCKDIEEMSAPLLHHTF